MSRVRLYTYMLRAIAIITNLAFPLLLHAQSAPNATDAPVDQPALAALEQPNTPDINALPEPFGANLFTGKVIDQRHNTLNPDYEIVPGDQISLKMWGAAESFNETVAVDSQGNIFVPEVGPINLKGVKQSELNQRIQAKARQVYNQRVGIYTNLQGSQPVSIFVAGGVLSPGRYSGVSSDSILDYLIHAGGIDPIRGSYRHIQVLRNNETVLTTDIYDFLRQGLLPQFRLHEGDTILVTERGSTVAVLEGALNPYMFEFTEANAITGGNLMAFASPLPNSTHALIEGARNGKPFRTYVTISNFVNQPLQDGDVVTFIQGKHSQDVSITITGAHLGAKHMVVPPDARLKEVLQNIPVNPAISNLDAIFIRRYSVAERQKQALQESVRRLEETLLLARASGKSQTPALSNTEASLLGVFMQRAQNIQPEGRVVVSHARGLSDISLEEGDEIVIPQYTDVVTVNGEILVPQAIVWENSLRVNDYIEMAGGFSDRANEDKIVIVRANGSTEIGTGVNIQPGDEIMVLPEVKITNLELATNVFEIIYKAAIAAAIPFQLN